MRVLIVGGSGYLGQFLVQAMLRDENVRWVGYTYNSKPIVGLAENEEKGCKGYRVDVATGEGAEACVADCIKDGALDLVVNCAAMSSPAGLYKLQCS
jgi:NAD(P)-dependent dehydrogenase (short-subunit alcohol dehydrogenase family)